MRLAVFLSLLLSSTVLFSCDGMVARSIRRSIISYQNNECACCRRHFGTFVPHEIHHLNHNSSDNERRNLVALCANCHGAHHRNGVIVGPYCPPFNKINIWKEAERDSDSIWYNH